VRLHPSRLLLPTLLLFTVPGPCRAQDRDAAAKAEELIREKKINDALLLLQEAISSSPEDPRLHVLTAKAIYIRAMETSKDPRLGREVLEDLSLVEEEARAALKSLPSSRDARMLLAQALYGRGKIQEAEKEVSRILQDHPGDGGARFLMGEICFLKAGKTRDRKEAAALRARAAGQYEKALQGGAPRAKTFRRLGDLATYEGDMEKALGYYGRALALDPYQAPHDWLFSRCAPSRGVDLYEKAAAAREKAGDRKGASFLLAWAGAFLEKQKKWKEARAVYDRSFALDPGGQWRSRYRAGWCCWWMGLKKEAEKEFLLLVRSRRPEFCDLLRNSGPEGKTAAAMMHALAAKAVAEGRTRDARDLSLLLATVRGGALDWNNYAFLCRETGEYEEAWQAYLYALGKAPRNPRILNDAALILQYHLHRNLGLAKKLYERAVASARKILADKNAKPADKSEAASALRDALNNLARLKRNMKRVKRGKAAKSRRGKEK